MAKKKVKNVQRNTIKKVEPYSVKYRKLYTNIGLKNLFVSDKTPLRLRLHMTKIITEVSAVEEQRLALVERIVKENGLVKELDKKTNERKYPFTDEQEKQINEEFADLLDETMELRFKIRKSELQALNLNALEMAALDFMIEDIDKLLEELDS